VLCVRFRQFDRPCQRSSQTSLLRQLRHTGSLWVQNCAVERKKTRRGKNSRTQDLRPSSRIAYTQSVRAGPGQPLTGNCQRHRVGPRYGSCHNTRNVEEHGQWLMYAPERPRAATRKGVDIIREDAGSIRTPAWASPHQGQINAGGSDRPTDLTNSIEVWSRLSATLLSCPKAAVRRVSLPLQCFQRDG
jgi:hypothetical protein